jgi:hypothetical protein
MIRLSTIKHGQITQNVVGACGLSVSGHAGAHDSQRTQAACSQGRRRGPNVRYQRCEGIRQGASGQLRRWFVTPNKKGKL